MTGHPAPRRRAVEQRGAGGPRIPAGLVFLAIAVLGSIAYLAYAITVRDTSQIPLLASGAVVVGLAFGALAVYCLRATWRAAREGRGGRSLMTGLIGGGAAMATAGCFAAAIILFQLAAAA